MKRNKIKLRKKYLGKDFSAIAILTISLFLIHGPLAHSEMDGYVNQFTLAEQLEATFTNYCQTTVRMEAVKINSLNNTIMDKVINAESSFTAVRETWIDGKLIRNSYKNLTQVIDYYNGLLDQRTSIPKKFRLDPTLIEDVLTQARWEALRPHLLPMIGNRLSLGWDTPDLDVDTWCKSANAREYEFFTLLNWLGESPEDVTEYDMKWVFRESGELQIAEASTKVTKTLHFLHESYSFKQLAPPDFYDWPSRANWIANRLILPSPNMSPEDDFAEASLRKDKLMMALVALNLKYPNNTLLSNWAKCGSRWYPFFTIFEPQRDNERIASLLHRTDFQRNMIKQLFDDKNSEITAAIFQCQLVSESDHCFVPNVPWTSETSANLVTPVSNFDILQETDNVDNSTLKIQNLPAPKTLTPYNAWRHICNWAAEIIASYDLGSDDRVNLKIDVVPKGWRLAFGHSEIRKAFIDKGIRYQPASTAHSANLLIEKIVSPQDSPSDFGTFSIRLLVKGQLPSEGTKRIFHVLGPWPPWFATCLSISIISKLILAGLFLTVIGIIVRWLGLYESRICSPLEKSYSVLRYSIFLSGFGLVIAILVLIPHDSFWISYRYLSLPMSVVILVPIIINVLFLLTQRRFWKETQKYARHEKWPLLTWGVLAITGPFFYLIFVWFLCPVSQPKLTQLGGDVQIIMATDGSVPRGVRTLYGHVVEHIFSELAEDFPSQTSVIEKFWKMEAGDSWCWIKDAFYSNKNFLLELIGFDSEAKIGGMHIEQGDPGMGWGYQLIACAWHDNRQSAPVSIVTGKFHKEDRNAFNDNLRKLFKSNDGTYGQPHCPQFNEIRSPDSTVFRLMLHHGDHSRLTPMSNQEDNIGEGEIFSDIASLGLWFPTPTRDYRKNIKLDVKSRHKWLKFRNSENASIIAGFDDSLVNALQLPHGISTEIFDKAAVSPEDLLEIHGQLDKGWNNAEILSLAKEIADKVIVGCRSQLAEHRMSKLVIVDSSIRRVMQFIIFSFLAVAIFIIVSQSSSRGTGRIRVVILIFGFFSLIIIYSTLWCFMPKISSFHIYPWLIFTEFGRLFVFLAIFTIFAGWVVNQAFGGRPTDSKNIGLKYIRSRSNFSTINNANLPKTIGLLIGTVSGSLFLIIAAMIWSVAPVVNAANSDFVWLRDLPSMGLLALAIWFTGVGCLVIPSTISHK